jgi:crotonobetainyl-CoA:carnitine CoA-transferase CaiB-like acyl-CoA transferase
MGGPLEGVRVLELAAMLNGAGAGYMLGDLGAEVTKIEDPVRGDLARGVQYIHGSALKLPGGANLFFECGNRNKRGIVLDLKNPKGRKIFHELAERSDIFITNYRHEVLCQLGADYETVSRHNPSLIYAVTSGYGTKGPDHDRRAFDQSAQARSGLMWSMGDRDSDEPIMMGGAVVDQCGATVLTNGILAALVHRERTGEGQRVETSMLGTAIHMLNTSVYAHFMRGYPMPRHTRKRCANPLYNLYKCQDGKWILMGEMDMFRFWDRFWEAIDRPEKGKIPEWADPVERGKHVKEIISELDQIFATKTRDEWFEVFRTKGEGIICEPVNSVGEACEDPQVLANNYIGEMDHHLLGHIRVTGVPVGFSKTPGVPRSPAPEFGQHTEEVLLELGYTWEDIVRIREDGALGGSEPSAAGTVDTR